MLAGQQKGWKPVKSAAAFAAFKPLDLDPRLFTEINAVADDVGFAAMGADDKGAEGDVVKVFKIGLDILGLIK